MKKIIHFSLIGIFAILLGACNQSTNSGSIAVLDLARVAKETGHSEKINQELQQVSNQLRNDLLQIQTKLQGEIKTSQAKIGSTPTDQQRQEFGQMINEAQNKLKKAQAQAAMTMQQKKNEALTRLRDDIKPVAIEIAKSRGMQIVFLKNETLMLAVQKDADITDDVIAKMKQMTPAKAETKKASEPVQEKKEDKKEVKTEEKKEEKK